MKVRPPWRSKYAVLGKNGRDGRCIALVICGVVLLRDAGKLLAHIPWAGADGRLLLRSDGQGQTNHHDGGGQKSHLHLTFLPIPERGQRGGPLSSAAAVARLYFRTCICCDYPL